MKNSRVCLRNLCNQVHACVQATLYRHVTYSAHEIYWQLPHGRCVQLRSADLDPCKSLLFSAKKIRIKIKLVTIKFRLLCRDSKTNTHLGKLKLLYIILHEPYVTQRCDNRCKTYNTSIETVSKQG